MAGDTTRNRGICFGRLPPPWRTTRVLKLREKGLSCRDISDANKHLNAGTVMTVLGREEFDPIDGRDETTQLRSNSQCLLVDLRTIYGSEQIAIPCHRACPVFLEA